jgi:dTDP-4-dehydrorhamnose 3,5-epimerase
MIVGVKLVDLDVHIDDRGALWEVVHLSDSFVSGQDQHMRQVYQVLSPMPGTVRAYHRHKELHDWFHVPAGAALFVLVSKNGLEYSRFTVSARKPQLLVVPPGIWHGWMSLEPNTLLTSVASHEYDRFAPDEERVEPGHFDHLFGGLKSDTPWRVIGK